MKTAFLDAYSIDRKKFEKISFENNIKRGPKMLIFDWPRTAADRVCAAM